MGLLARLFGTEKRSGEVLRDVSLRDDPRAFHLFTHSARFRGHAGPEAAVSHVAEIARAVALISEDLAALPLPVCRWLPGGDHEEVPDHPLYGLLNYSANEGMTAYELRALLVRDLVVHGNAYARAERDGYDGSLRALHYWPSRSVGVERLRSGRLRYQWSDPTTGANYVLTSDDVVHLRMEGRDGMLGVSPLGWAAEAVGLVLAQSELAREQADSGNVPPISFTTDTSFSDNIADPAWRRLKEQLTSAVRGLRSGDPLLLEGGVKPTPLAVAGREAQFAEARVQGLKSMATLLGIPHSVLGLSSVASYGSLQEEARALVMHALTPMAKRIEAQLQHALLSTRQRRSHFIAHDFDSLQRGDMKAQYEAYSKAVGGPFLAINEARTALGWNKTEGGDEVSRPMNMAPAGAGETTQS